VVGTRVRPSARRGDTFRAAGRPSVRGGRLRRSCGPGRGSSPGGSTPGGSGRTGRGPRPGLRSHQWVRPVRCAGGLRRAPPPPGPAVVPPGSHGRVTSLTHRRSTTTRRGTREAAVPSLTAPAKPRPRPARDRRAPGPSGFVR